MALRLMVQPQSDAGLSPGMYGPANLQTAFTRLRERLETKDVTIKHVKEVALKSLVRAKALIDVERDPL